jgi:leucyl aminopeptidase (aminopeptidase T)
MKAMTSDWLVVHSHADGRPVRRAVILAVGEGGEPPYTVRWTDNDHEAVVFPGPDASVVSAAAEAERARVEREQVSKVQADIRVGSQPAR